MTHGSNSSSDASPGKVDIPERVRNFKDLLEKIESLDTQKRRLWLEIYENAITDRQNAFSCYARLNQLCGESSSEHAVHGKTIATYLERMSKANDQLIKLADLVAKASGDDEEIDKDKLFEKIAGQGR